MTAAPPLQIAFYKGVGRWDDRLIRIATQSPFSHVELLRGNTMLSASIRDGGVRLKKVELNSDHWTLLPLEGWERGDAWERAVEEIGRPYDLTGILLTFTVPLRRHRRRSWFCSELCAHALGLGEPHTLAPGDLFRRVLEMNQSFLAGFEEARRIRPKPGPG